MEQAWFRMAVVLAVICAAVGVGASVHQYIRLGDVQVAVVRLKADADSSQARCLEVATRSFERYYCKRAHAVAMSEVSQYPEIKERLVGKIKGWLVLAVIGPLAILGTFYVIRWISTGRWRDKA